MDRSRIVSSKDFGPSGFRWLTLKRITWEDGEGVVRFWESAERTTRGSSGIDAVAIVAKITSKSSPPQVIIVSQFRPPLDAICLELPAGLIDEGEDAGMAALRELKEETGYSATLISVSETCSCDPGMSNANMQVALVEIDSSAPENTNVQQDLHDGECITVDMAPWDGLYEWLVEKKTKFGYEVDARLLSFAMGIQIQSQQSLLSNEDRNCQSMTTPQHRSIGQYVYKKESIAGMAVGFAVSMIFKYLFDRRQR